MRRALLIRYRRVRNRLLAKLYGRLGGWLMRLLYLSCKKESRGIEHLLKGRCIVALWHNRIGMAAPFLIEKAPGLTYAPLISQSRDGEALAQLISSYSQGEAIRIKHHLKHQGLKELIRRAKKEELTLILTPDGPRGPRCRAKEGIALCSRLAKLPIVPLTWEAKRYWTLKSWDGFRIPKPFTTISYRFSPPLLIPKKEEGPSLCLQLEEALNRTEEAEGFFSC